MLELSKKKSRNDGCILTNTIDLEVGRRSVVSSTENELVIRVVSCAAATLRNVGMLTPWPDFLLQEKESQATNVSVEPFRNSLASPKASWKTSSRGRSQCLTSLRKQKKRLSFLVEGSLLQDVPHSLHFLFPRCQANWGMYRSTLSCSVFSIFVFFRPKKTPGCFFFSGGGGGGGRFLDSTVLPKFLFPPTKTSG